MMSYKDTTFCCSSNCRNKCGRKLTPEVIEGARKWWGNSMAPIATAEFCDDKGTPIKVVTLKGTKQ